MLSAISYRWFCLRCWWLGLPERMAWWLAWQLPRRVALMSFVRVYAVLGNCGDDYERAYRLWEAGKGR